jgi:hypothetical protein
MVNEERKKVVTLRGHHIVGGLADRYLLRLYGAEELDLSRFWGTEKKREKENKSTFFYWIKEKVSKLENILFKYEHRPKHGEAFLNALRSFQDFLLDNPDTLILVVDGLDDICNMSDVKCGAKEPSCEDPEDDRRMASVLDLEIGQTYTMEEIMRRIKVYYELAGEPPLTKYLKQYFDKKEIDEIRLGRLLEKYSKQ